MAAFERCIQHHRGLSRCAGGSLDLGRRDVEFNGVEDDFRGWMMDREGDGFLSYKASGGQVRLQSQIVANRDHMSRKPVWIERAWSRGLIHILTFRSFGGYLHEGTVEARAEERCKRNGQEESDMLNEGL